VKESQALYILEQATNVFSREPNMVALKSPVTSPLFFLSSLIYDVLMFYSLWRYPWSICEPSVHRRLESYP